MKRIVLVISILLVIGIVPVVLNLTPNIKKEDSYSCDVVLSLLNTDINFNKITKNMEVLEGKILDVNKISNNKIVYSLCEGVYRIIWEKYPYHYIENIEVTEKDFGKMKYKDIAIVEYQIPITINILNNFDYDPEVSIGFYGGIYECCYTTTFVKNNHSLGLSLDDYTYEIKIVGNEDMVVKGTLSKKELIEFNKGYNLSITFPYYKIGLEFYVSDRTLENYELMCGDTIFEPKIVETFSDRIIVWYEVYSNKKTYRVNYVVKDLYSSSFDFTINSLVVGGQKIEQILL